MNAYLYSLILLLKLSFLLEASFSPNAYNRTINYNDTITSFNFVDCTFNDTSNCFIVPLLLYTEVMYWLFSLSKIIINIVYE